MDTLHYLWNGSWPKNRAPMINEITINRQVAEENINLASGGEYHAVVSAEDREGDALSYSWLIMKESESKQHGGDKERVPDVVSRIESTSSISFVAPRKAGAYRLFVYVTDSNGRVAHANIPFYSRSSK